MAKKNRASVLKRQREAEKRERQVRRAAKAALKRERRAQKKDGEPLVIEAEDVQTVIDPSPDIQTDPGPQQNPT